MRAASFTLALLLLVPAFALGQRPVPATAPFLIVVNRANPTRSITRGFLADALLKRVTRWPHGEGIQPVDLDAGSPVRRRVTEDVLGRTVPAVRSYWQQMIFSGRGVPPVDFPDDRSVVRYVAGHRGAIGYVSGTADTTGVAVVQLR